MRRREREGGSKGRYSALRCVVRVREISRCVLRVHELSRCVVPKAFAISPDVWCGWGRFSWCVCCTDISNVTEKLSFGTTQPASQSKMSEVCSAHAHITCVRFPGVLCVCAHARFCGVSWRVCQVWQIPPSVKYMHVQDFSVRLRYISRPLVVRVRVFLVRCARVHKPCRHSTPLQHARKMRI